MANGLTLMRKFQLCPTTASDFFGCKVILGAADLPIITQKSATVYIFGHLEYFRARNMVERATSKRVGEYLDFDIVKRFKIVPE